MYEELDKFKPDIIGLTTFTSFYTDTIEFANKIKAKYSDAPDNLIDEGLGPEFKLPGAFEEFVSKPTRLKEAAKSEGEGGRIQFNEDGTL